MTFTATVTSQGQITIPAKVREILGLTDENRKVLLSVDEEKQSVNIKKKLTLAEAEEMFQTLRKPSKVTRNLSLEETIEKENQSLREEIARRYSSTKNQASV